MSNYSNQNENERPRSGSSYSNSGSRPQGRSTGSSGRKPMTPEERERRRRANRQAQILKALLLVVVLLVVIAGVVLFIITRSNSRKTDKKETLPSVSTTSPEEMTTAAETTTEAPTVAAEYQEVYDAAKRLKDMYDYDAAISYVQTEAPGYESDPMLLGLVQSCEAEKLLLVKWRDNTQITHVFFHSLIADNAVAFASAKRDEYNKVMTTIPEFNAILENMYERGYVLVHLSDIAKIEKQADGSEQMTMQPIFLPEGKKPFVLSIDDLSYYEYMKDTGGFANRLVVDESGKVVCEMDLPEEGGGVSHVRGNFDVIPLLDAFVEEHPDFSYHGAKGTIALTGYNGILGYRTSEIAYGAGDPNWPSAYEYENPNIEADREKAKQVAEALKASGWKFASHTWGHMDMSSVHDENGEPTERFYRDTDWWEEEVEPLIGDTDIIIFAFGADIGSWRGYTDENKMYLYLKEKGFDYYCNVDSSTHYWVQLNPTAGGTGYLRQGRRNLDGMLLYKAIMHPEDGILDDLFDAYEVFDRDRPLPVDGVVIPEGVDASTLPAPASEAASEASDGTP